MEDSGTADASGRVNLEDQERRSNVAHHMVLRPLDMGPITKLPLELLLSIFMYVAASGGFTLEKDEYEAGRSWLSITHTCQYWRTLAIASPLLWDAVKIEEWSLGLAGTFLMRATNVPLRIAIFDVSSSPFEEESLHRMAQLLLPHSGRIVLFFATLCAPNLRMLASLLTEPAPRLASLDLRLLTLSEPIHVEDIFRHEFPSLRNLTSVRVSLPRSHQIYAGLTTLRISNPPNSLDIDALTSLLGETSVLQTLKLSIFSRDKQVTCLRPGRTVRLPDLRTLNLQVHTTIIHHFFLHITFPSTAKLTLRVAGRDHERRSLFAQSDAVESVRQSAVQADFTFSVDLAFIVHPKLALHVVARDAAEEKRFEVEHLWYVPTVGPLDLSHVDPEIHSFSRLTALSIDIQSMEVSPAQWASILSNLVRLTTMQVKMYDADLRLVQGLAMQRPLNGGLLCPALVEMRIHGTLWGKDRNESTLQSALDALEHRALLGCPLSTFSVITDTAGALSTEYLTRLRRVVARVEHVVGYVTTYSNPGDLAEIFIGRERPPSLIPRFHVFFPLICSSQTMEPVYAS